MPYIKPDRREALLGLVFTSMASMEPETAGELNFNLTQSCVNYMAKHGKSYATINDIIGALEGADGVLPSRSGTV